MRVCIIAYRLYDGNTHMIQFARALAGRGDSVDIVSLRADGLPAREVVDGVRVYRIQRRTNDEKHPVSYLFKLFPFAIHALLLLAWNHWRDPYQIVHVQTVPDLLVFVALGAKLGGARVILDVRDVTPELYCSKFKLDTDSRLYRLLLFFERAAARFADHVIVANPIWHARLVNRSTGRSRSTMIWYYPDPSAFYPRPKKRIDGKFVLLYPGTLNWHQGLDIAVRAFARIVREVPNAEFRIYGEGPEKRRLIGLTRGLGLEASVKWLPPVPVKEVADVMAEADVAVVPKRAGSGFGNEAASTKIFEFLALGVPVVASRTQIESLYFDDSVIRFYEGDSADALADAVIALNRHPEQAAELVANGIRYMARSDLRCTQQSYLRLVDSLEPRNK